MTVSKITVTGADFKGPIGITTPLTLSPGQAATFQIIFAPSAGRTWGRFRSNQRTYSLTGLGLDPRCPGRPSNLLRQPSPALSKRRSPIQLAAASQVAGTGIFTMTFQSAVAGVTDDPAIQFLTGPPAVATVTISPGDSVAKFGTAADITFQTGSTAGVILFTLQIGDTTQQASLSISSGTGIPRHRFGHSSTAGSVVVGLVGYDNTYSASQLQFTFYDTTGKPLPPGLMTVDVSQNFKSYFQTTQAGGSFQLRASFLISGDSAVLGGVDVSITNSVGVTTTQRINL